MFPLSEQHVREVGEQRCPREAAKPSPPLKEKKGIQQVGVTPYTKHQLRADEQFPEEGGFGVTWARWGKSPESPQTLITHQKPASVPVRGGPIEQRLPIGGPQGPKGWQLLL